MVFVSVFNVGRILPCLGPSTGWLTVELAGAEWKGRLLLSFFRCSVIDFCAE